MRQQQSRHLKLGIALSAAVATICQMAPASAVPTAALPKLAPTSVTTSESTVPSGAVIVTLKEQFSTLPATGNNVGARKSQAFAQQQAVLQRAGIKDGANVKHFSLVNGFATTITDAQAAKLAKDPAVQTVVADTKIPVKTPRIKRKSTSGAKSSGAKLPTAAQQDAPPTADPFGICPDDPAKPILEPEALSDIRAANQDGTPNAQQMATGTGVRVAVFAEAIDPTAQDYLRPDGTSAIVDYQNFSGSPDTVEAHEAYGEEIFGDDSSIAAQGRVVHDLSDFVNPAHALPKGCNIQIRGVAPGADVVAMKILSGGDGSSYALASAMAQAIDYAVTVDHVNVLSESVGAVGTPDAGTRNVIQQFNDQAIKAGVSVVASTGDAGTTGTIGSPASDPLVISAAGSTTQRAAFQTGYTGTSFSNGKWINGNIASFSSGGFTNSGTVPVLTAPGDSGWAACTEKRDLPGCTAYGPDADGNAKQSSIELFGGTSQSAPFIAGVAALVIQAYRDSHVGVTPSPALVRQILTSSAKDLGAPSSEQGAGEVDALAAVRLAKAYKSKVVRRPANTGGVLLLSKDQFTNSGPQGGTSVNTLTVTNTAKDTVALAPGVRKLVPIENPFVTQVTLDERNDPSVISHVGAKATYKKLNFTIKPNVAQFAITLAYPSAADYNTNGGQAQVTIALIDPNGNYIGSTRPQGGTSSSNYGTTGVVKPAAGEWTAIVSTTPTVGSFGGTPVPMPAYSGPVNISVTQNKWVTAGTVSPAKVGVRPGQSVTLKVSSRMPVKAGDSALSLTLGAPALVGNNAVPIVQRVLINTAGGRGTFSGGITGGNGRALQPAQIQTFAFNVPTGQRSLDVSLNTSPSASIPRLITSLVDPNGYVQSMQNNADSSTNTSAVGRVVTNDVANPVPGRWRLIVRTVSPSTGLDLVTPFTGTVGFNNPGVSSTDLDRYSASTPAGLSADQATSLAIKVTNRSSAPQTYYADGRTNKKVQIPLDAIQTHTPASVYDWAFTPSYMVPPLTTKISTTVTSKVAVQAQMTAPSAAAMLAGPNAIGPAAQPVKGTASSTVTMSTPSGSLPTGGYTTLANGVGPYGLDGAKPTLATITGVLSTMEFDKTVSSPSSSTTIQPGETGTLLVRIRPDQPIGTVVSGLINVVQVGRDYAYAALQYPSEFASYQVLSTYKYTYKVAPQVPRLSGTISDGAAGIAKVRVVAYDSDGNEAAYVDSRPDGTYSIGGLLAGDYKVCFLAKDAVGPSQGGYQDGCYKGQDWDGVTAPPATATTVTVPATGAVTGIDDTLKQAAGVGGTVKNEQGAAVSDVPVAVYDLNGELVSDPTIVTDANGKYKVVGLDGGQYFVCFPASLMTKNLPNGYGDQCNGKSWNRDTAPSTADGYTPVTLTVGQLTTVDATLKVVSSISGRVRDAYGADMPALVFAFGADGTPVGASQNTVDGVNLTPYTVQVDPGTYAVCAVALDGSNAAQCWDHVYWKEFGQTLPDGWSPVTVPDNKLVRNIDFDFPAASGAKSALPPALVKYLQKTKWGQQQLELAHKLGAR